jgi:cysteine-S-conjugate beta-lyase
MKQYDLDAVIERTNTNSIKFDYLKEEAMLPLWVADMDFPVCDAIVEAGKKRLDHPIFGYSSIPSSLYESLCNWQRRRHGICYPSDQIIPYYSVVSAINLILMALTKKKDVVTIMSPVYMRFPTSVYETGRSLRVSPLLDKYGKYEINFENLETCLKTSKALLLCNPHNPVGRVFTEAELRKIYLLAEKYDILVISDEVHADIIMPPFKHIPFTSIDPGAQKRTITLVSSTKTFNMAQAGIAFIIATNKLHSDTIKKVLESYHLGAMNVLSVEMVQAAYTYGDQWLDQVIDYVKGNYNYLKRAIETSMPRIHLFPMEGTYLAWLDMRRIPISVVEFFETRGRIRGEDGILFGSEGEGFYRLNLATQRINIEHAVSQMKIVYDELFHR